MGGAYPIAEPLTRASEGRYGGRAMANTKQVATSSFPLAGFLGVLFIGLKLAEVGAVAHWPWVWVLSPFWIPLALVLSILAVIFVGALVLDLGRAVFGARSRKAKMERVTRGY